MFAILALMRDIYAKYGFNLFYLKIIKYPWIKYHPFVCIELTNKVCLMTSRVCENHLPSSSSQNSNLNILGGRTSLCLCRITIFIYLISFLGSLYLIFVRAHPSLNGHDKRRQLKRLKLDRKFSMFRNLKVISV